MCMKWLYCKLPSVNGFEGCMLKKKEREWDWKGKLNGGSSAILLHLGLTFLLFPTMDISRGIFGSSLKPEFFIIKIKYVFFLNCEMRCNTHSYV